ncbi:MAG: hypothetical protein OEZ39_16465 [Gammaproteobacteria bacterium]|nr:hypothetical protein [Gammaproteobacteria bacterium]MDH5653454.1 hypothetical protein [Gammaproteobacteria bacterium]
MSLTTISSQYADKKPSCRICKAGSSISFNWSYAMEGKSADLPNSKDIYINPEPLKTGVLYQCRHCQSYWYLDADEQYMHHVADSKVALVQAWSQSDLRLSPQQLDILQAIGRTAPDIYGNGTEYNETPCQVKTTDGTLYPLAIISIQQHAPYEAWRNCKLATEIAEISPSPYALPHEVRLATTQAEEVSMSFAPTLVQLSNGEVVILNWTNNFIKKPAIDSSKTTLSDKSFNRNNMPPLYRLADEIVYFIADA